MMYFPRVGGAEVALREITDRISPEEYEFHMVTIGADKNLPAVEQIGNVLVHRIGLFKKEDATINDFYTYPLKLNKWLYQFSGFFYAIKLHKKYRYDGIWAMLANGASVPSVLFNLFYSKIFYVLTLQEGHPAHIIKRRMLPVYPLFALSFKRADVIQAISNYLGNFGRSMGFTGPLEVIPNGVDVEVFTQEYPEHVFKEVQQKMDWKDGRVYLIHTGRMAFKNALDDVVRALPLLPKHVCFVQIGDGPDESDLKQLAKELDVYDRVTFLSQVDNKTLPMYLKQCDIFIRPSRSEGMGNSFIEAMAAEIPVIGTQEGGIADFLFDARRNPDKAPTGWAVDVGSSKQIAEAVMDIVNNPQKVATVTKTARKLAEEKYDWNLIARDMKEKVFSRIVAEPR